MTMNVRFWGVRGSIAAPGDGTRRIGGNTACVEVTCGGQRLVFDAGTGLRGLGETLVGDGPQELTLLLSHLHWDHIQGLPFFLPIYLPSTRLTVAGATGGSVTLRDALAAQMRAPVFPVSFEDLPAEIGFRTVRPAECFRVGDVLVRTAKGNHPGGVLAYSVEYEGARVVYATDTEHYSCVDPALLALAEGADLLIYDSQYTNAEYRGEVGRSKVGWGHSTWEAGVALAEAAGVDRYVLFHHDPQRDDAGVEAIEGRARAHFARAVAAREGMCIELSPHRATEAA